MGGIARKLARADRPNRKARHQELLRKFDETATAIEAQRSWLEHNALDYEMACNRFEDDGGPVGPRYPSIFYEIYAVNNVGIKWIHAEARRLGVDLTGYDRGGT